jgi:adenosylcobinamide-GDP ribazoletransferase
MIKREAHIFLTAVMFYTRVPCPRWVDHNAEYITRATRYLPLIGCLVGLAYAASIALLLNIFSPVTSILLSIVVSVLITGAFHEDGFADVCDGFGGGWTRDKILSIMKDSRVGSYGVIGLILLLGIKVTITTDLLSSLRNIQVFILAIVTSHTVSRLAPVFVIYFLRYARDESEESKAKPVAVGIKRSDVVFASVPAIVPLALFVSQTTLFMLITLVVVALTTTYLARYFRKWIGGYTGDCLGTIQQVTEVTFLLTSYVVWRFI